MGAKVIPFPRRCRPNPHGVVWIAPVDEGGGEWGVFHQIAPKVAPIYLGSRLAYNDAERFARLEATKLRATFDDNGGYAA